MIQRAWVIQLAGLAAILLILAIVLPRHTQMIPAKIAEQAQEKLQAGNLSWAVVRSEPEHSRNLLLAGSVPDEQAKQTALNQLNSLWYVRQVKDTTTPKMIEPYTLHLQWDGSRLVLDGYVSNGQEQTALLAQVQSEFGDGADTEQLQAGLGAPEHWDTLINTVLLPEIKKLQSVSVRMTDKTINFAGKPLPKKLLYCAKLCRWLPQKVMS